MAYTLDIPHTQFTFIYNDFSLWIDVLAFNLKRCSVAHITREHNISISVAGTHTHTRSQVVMIK